MPLSNGIGKIVWIYLIVIKGDAVRGQAAGPNAVALINGQTMLDCLTNVLAASSWTRTTDGSSNALVIATGCIVTASNAAYYRTEQPGGKVCRLIIGNATMQQAGVYNCLDGVSMSYRSLVTIIDPVASVVVYNRSEVVVDDRLNISCSINYTGPSSPAPSLRPSPYWTSPGQIFINETYHPSTNVVTLVAAVTVQRPTVPIFQCITVFEVTGSTVGYNATAPADSFTVGNTTEQHVQYPPENISIQSTVSTKDNCVSKPENLTCTADANPPAQYNWVDLSNNSTSTGAVKFINSSGQYQCTAYNVIRNQTYNEKKTATEVDCYQVTVDNTTISGSNCTNNSCTCGDQSFVMLTCQAYGYPKPTFKWWSDGREFEDLLNGSIVVKIDGTYNCVSSNEFGGKIYNATVSIDVSNCKAAETTKWSNTAATTTQPSSNTTTENPGGGKKGGGLKTGEKVGIAIGCFVAFLNVASTCLFPVYYNKDKVPHSETNERSGNIKTKSNKLRLNRRFPWLKKMLPCLNDTKEDVGSNCLWVSLYILLGTFTGIVTFPILILLSKKSEKNIETSALNQRENGAANESTANGRRTVNYPHPRVHRTIRRERWVYTEKAPTRTNRGRISSSTTPSTQEAV